MTPALPRGAYELGCRLLDPVTGKTKGESKDNARRDIQMSLRYVF